MINRKILLIIAVASILSCVSYRQDAPCFDGWTMDASGPSRILNPTANERSLFETLMLDEQKYVCAHVMPSEQIIIISRGKNGLHTTRIMGNMDEYKILDRGFIVSNR